MFLLLLALIWQHIDAIESVRLLFGLPLPNKCAETSYSMKENMIWTHFICRIVYVSFEIERIFVSFEHLTRYNGSWSVIAGSDSLDKSLGFNNEQKVLPELHASSPRLQIRKLFVWRQVRREVAQYFQQNHRIIPLDVISTNEVSFDLYYLTNISFERFL